MILPECRWMWQGIEGADSVVLNAHKWLGAAFDCSLYYVRDPEHLVRVMSTNPSFLQSAVDNQVKNLRDWGIPLGQRFRALKLWCRTSSVNLPWGYSDRHLIVAIPASTGYTHVAGDNAKW
jgi:glutamate/tyrosine decarboxylase-like PLP-dependent enzyme